MGIGLVPAAVAYESANYLNSARWTPKTPLTARLSEIRAEQKPWASAHSDVNRKPDAQ